jgi:hypothetical protein
VVYVTARPIAAMVGDVRDDRSSRLDSETERTATEERDIKESCLCFLSSDLFDVVPLAATPFYL